MLRDVDRKMCRKSGGESCAEVGMYGGTGPWVKNGWSMISCNVGRSCGSGVRICEMRCCAWDEMVRSGGKP